LNVQGLLNSFNWGLDNRIHGATAPNGGIVTNLAVPSEMPLDLNNRNFSFDPRTLKMRAENGGGQYGMSFDSRGRKFVCSNSDHIMTFMYDGRYADRNPLFAMPRALASIAVDGGAAEVYRISPEEPWRVIRTKWRVAGVATGPIEGGGRSAGYFTGATGVTIYRGNAFPEDFRDNAFTGDAGGNLVHRKLVLPDGVGVKAQRPSDEQKVEFLASSDTWFRPVQFANAPDGTFYVIDMHRETIEHPWSLPEQMKKYLDLNSGNDRGRIFRIVPENFKQPKLPKLGKASTKELIATLENANGWHRDAAARLLFQRQDKSAVVGLKKLARNSKSPLGRLHAIHSLEGLNGLSEDDVLAALNDSDATVREHAIKLSENFLADSVPSKMLLAKYESLTKDRSINVRYQLAFTLGEVKHAKKVSALRDIIQQDMENSWMRAAVLSSLAEGAGEMFGLMVSGPTAQEKGGQEFLRQLVLIIGAKNNSSEIAQVIDFLAKSKDRALSFSLVRALGDGLQHAGSSIANVEDVKKIFAQAGEVAANTQEKEATRIQAIQLLGLTRFSESGQTLRSLLNQNQSQAIQLAAVAALANLQEPEVAAQLIEPWKTFTPRLQSEALSALLARPERVTALLQAVEKGAIRPSDLASPQITFLKNHRDPNIRKKATELFAASSASQRQDVINAFQPAINLQGDIARGKIIYAERCASCHRFDHQGFALGPDFVTIQNSGKEKMLVNMLDPNREVAPNFRAYEVETKDDESLIGMVANETATSVTLRQAFGKEDVILRSQIKKMQSQNNSLMPEGLEAGLTQQQVADLLEYISVAPAK
jgi:putative membrane-bound dehydrogenase-like protein